ncbi:hypothetical protein CHS0354_004250 [Potamilus streckersoni]|uniref:Apextrin C-terminal domain-containing protein n=1 Tax=Potamilus streckersoni TaxID=2493646 RepID=A0AAE0S475_9BIVA|nr:hypothetical protein CHS0354_004250 [Potamilus streckersoni]
MDLASSRGFSITEHFAATVCSLPPVYDITKYMSFLDTWGTAPDDVTIGGPYKGAFLSYHINLDSFKYRHEFNTIIGYLEDALKFGTAIAPEPIGMKLTTIDLIFSNEYWKNLEIYSLGQCNSNISQKMNTLRANIIRALNEYASYKNAETPTAIQLDIPVTWPNGTYGIPRPKTGCPQGNTAWKTGWRYEDTETQDPSNTWSSSIDQHMEGKFHPISQKCKIHSAKTS